MSVVADKSRPPYTGPSSKSERSGSPAFWFQTLGLKKWFSAATRWFKIAM